MSFIPVDLRAHVLWIVHSTVVQPSCLELHHPNRGSKTSFFGFSFRFRVLDGKLHRVCCFSRKEEIEITLQEGYHGPNGLTSLGVLLKRIDLCYSQKQKVSETDA